MCNSISTFVKNNQTLCILTGGLSIVGFLAWRFVVWLTSLCGTAKKTDQLAREILEKNSQQRTEIVPETPTKHNPVEKVDLVPVRIKKSICEMATVTLDLTISFLRLAEFATLRSASKQLARINLTEYTIKHPHCLTRMLHLKDIGDYSDYWQRGALKAAALITEFNFPHNTPIARFAAIKTHFSKLERLTFPPETDTSTIEACSLLLPTITSLHIPKLEMFTNLTPIFKHTPLQTLKIQAPLGGGWWESDVSKQDTFEVCPPNLKVLEISYLFDSNIEPVAEIGKLISLQQLSLEIDVDEERWEKIQQTITSLAPKLTQLQTLAIRFTHRSVANGRLIEMFANFLTLQKLSFAFFNLSNEAITALAKLTHIKSLELGIQIDEIGDLPELNVQLDLITKLASLPNLKTLKILENKRITTSKEWHHTRIQHLLEHLGTIITEIHDAGPDWTDLDRPIQNLSKLENCHFLCLKRSKRDCAGIKNLVRKLPKLKKLRLSGIEIQGSKKQTLTETESPSPPLDLDELRLELVKFYPNGIDEFGQWNIATNDIVIMSLKNMKEEDKKTKEDYCSDVEMIKLLNEKKFKHFQSTTQPCGDPFLLYLSSKQKDLQNFSITYDQSITQAGIQALYSLPLLEKVALPRAVTKNKEIAEVLKKRSIFFSPSA